MKVKLTPAQSEVVGQIKADKAQAVYYSSRYYWSTCYLAGGCNNIPTQTVAALIIKKVLVIDVPSRGHTSPDRYKINPDVELVLTEREVKVFVFPYIYEALPRGIKVYKTHSEGAIQIKAHLLKEDGEVSMYKEEFSVRDIDYEKGRVFSTRRAAEIKRVELCEEAVSRAMGKLGEARGYLIEARTETLR